MPVRLRETCSARHVELHRGLACDSANDRHGGNTGISGRHVGHRRGSDRSCEHRGEEEMGRRTWLTIRLRPNCRGS